MSDAKPYTPELGQMCFGAPTGAYDMPDYACALLAEVMHEIERVYGNVNQREWNQHDDPGFAGIKYHAYTYNENDEQPNFVVDGFTQEVRWYKHYRRGQSCTEPYTADQWVAWFDAAIKAVRAADVRLRG